MARIKGKQIAFEQITLNHLAPDLVSILNSGSSEPLVFDEPHPELTVHEERTFVDQNGNEQVELRFVIENAEPSEGRLALVQVYYQTADSQFHKPLVEFINDDSLGSVDTITFYHSVLLSEKPQQFTFTAQLYNPSMEAWKIDGTIVNLTHILSVSGVPDLVEYVEGIDLACINTNDPEGGTATSNILKFKWTDIRNLPASTFPINSNDAYGRFYSITSETKKLITGYVMYMFISSNGNPAQHGYPGKAATYGSIGFGQSVYGYRGPEESDPNGTWVFAGEFTAPYAEIKCPDGADVQFWLGCKTRRTQSTIQTPQVPY